MRISALKKELISNFYKLDDIAKINQVDKDIVPIWKMNYKNGKQTGYVSQLGNIQLKHSCVKIKGDDIYWSKKPIWGTFKQTLKKANKLLKNIIENIQNKDIVKKEQYEFLCRNERDIIQIDTLQKLNRMGL